MTLGYIILPPGHGKSYLHDPTIDLYEADSVVPNKATKELREKRKRAKITGDWSDYDTCWATLLVKALPEDGVVLVPADQVGQAIRAVRLGACYLDESVWAENFRDRPDTAEKHIAAWEEAKRLGTFMRTNRDTTHWVHSLVNAWAVREQLYRIRTKSTM